jgi:hypothetical protein
MQCSEQLPVGPRENQNYGVGESFIEILHDSLARCGGAHLQS